MRNVTASGVFAMLRGGSSTRSMQRFEQLHEDHASLVNVSRSVEGLARDAVSPTNITTRDRNICILGRDINARIHGQKASASATPSGRQ